MGQLAQGNKYSYIGLRQVFVFCYSLKEFDENMSLND